MQLARDVRGALRLFLREPLPTAVAWLSIALSVGATAVVFAAVQSVLLDPLPYARPEELVLIRGDRPADSIQSASDWSTWNEAQEIVRRNRTLSGVGTWRNSLSSLAGDSSTPPQAVYGLRISPDLFPLLGVAPVRGRNILPGEESADELILSDGLWRRRFHADPSIVGGSVTIDGRACTIIGIMAAGFNFPLRREAAHTPSPYVEFWAPLTPAARQGGVGAVGRLQPGVSLAEARQDIRAIGEQLAREFPQTNRDRVLSLNPLRDRMLRGAPGTLSLLMGAALLFMLIGCANVANLLLLRGLSRQREVAIRLALGARPGSIVRQLLTESCLLAVLGGLGGYLLAAAAWKVLPSVAPVNIPRLAAAHAGRSVFVFSLLLAVINGIVFGVAPALRLARGQISALSAFGLRGVIPGGRDHLRSALVIAEVALSMLLVVTGGQLLGNFRRLIATDPGFRAEHVLGSVLLPAPDQYRSPEQRGLFYRRVLDAARAIPGVDLAGAVDALPFSGENHGAFVSVREYGASEPLTAEIDVAGGDYLQAMGIRLLEGRWFREDDLQPSNDTAIVNTFLARRLWPGASALGQRLCVYCSAQNPRNWKRVVGVVNNVNHMALDQPEIGNVYLAAGAYEKAEFLVVRTARPFAETERAVRHAVAAVDPNQPVFLTASLRDLIGDSVADRRFLMLLLTITASLALALSAAGVYGVVAYTTTRRTQEVGIRMAVGATPGNILSLIFRQGFVVVGLGLTIGLAAALGSMRWLHSVLSGLETVHTAPIWISAIVVTLAAALACWLPARRATRIDPMTALREE